MSILDFERAEYVQPHVISLEQTDHGPESVDTDRAFREAILHGSLAALGGAFLYALVGIWVQIGLVAVLVGAMVGAAMMRGSEGVWVVAATRLQRF